MSRRDEDPRSRASRTAGTRRGSSATARLNPTPRTLFETLESRLLLSGVTSNGDDTTLSVSIPVASLILVEPTPSNILPIASATTSVSTAIPASTLDPTVAQPTVQATVASPLIAVVSPGVQGHSGAIGGLITVLSTGSGDLGEDSITPIIVLASSTENTGMTPSMGDDTPPGYQSGYITPRSTGGSVIPSTYTPPIVSTAAAQPASPRGGIGFWGGIGDVRQAIASSSSPLPKIPVIATIPSVSPPSVSTAPAGYLPDTRHLEVEGTIDPSQNYLTLRIPVGPTTRELGLSVRGSSGSGTFLGPVLGQMSLVDRNGKTLAHLDPLVDDQTGGPTEDVTLSLNDVPVGGSLIVQIAATASVASGPSATAAGPASPPSSASSPVPFVMDVQRLETGASSAAVGTGSLPGQFAGVGQLVIGTLTGTVDRQGQSLSANGATASPQSFGSATTVAVDPGEPAPVSEEGTIVDSEPSDFGARIATGPLAARAAAPLGPNLSNVSIDQAPAIDRHERALSQEITSNDSDEDQTTQEVADSGEKLFEAQDRVVDGKAGGTYTQETATVSIAGLGPLPLKASGLRLHDGRSEMDALHAALADSVRSEDHPAELAAGDLDPEALLVSLVSPTSSGRDRRPTPDYLTSACILALGMGLITGPIIPDLLRLIPSRSSRWRSVRAGHPIPSAGGPRERGFGLWLRRRLHS